MRQGIDSIYEEPRRLPPQGRRPSGGSQPAKPRSELPFSPTGSGFLVLSHNNSEFSVFSMEKMAGRGRERVGEEKFSQPRSPVANSIGCGIITNSAGSTCGETLILSPRERQYLTSYKHTSAAVFSDLDVRQKRRSA